MANLDRAFAVDEGISIDDYVGVFHSTLDPSIGAGFDAPKGSILLDSTSGKLWVKFDVTLTDWISPVTIPDDKTVKLSASDSTADFLGGKISAGVGIGFATVNPGANEILEISAIGGTTDELVKISINDTTPGYLNSKIVGGTGILISEINNGSNETLLIQSTMTAIDLATVTLGLTNTGPISQTFTNVLWPVTHVENNIAVIEHDGISNERILIKETGLYFLSYNISFDADIGEEIIEARCLINDLTIIPGSLRRASEDDEINDLSNNITVELSAGDYVTFQIRANGNGNTLELSSGFMMTRASGQQGAQGNPGSGSTITVMDEGIALTNSPANTINFIGNDVTVTNGVPGQVDVNIVPNIILKNFFHAHNAGVTQTLTSSYVTARIATDVRSDIIFSNTLGEVTINKTGNFKIEYEITADTTGGRSTSECLLQRNNTTIPGTKAFGYHRNGSSGEDTSSVTTIIAVTSGDVIRVRIREKAGSVRTVNNGCRLTISEID